MREFDGANALIIDGRNLLWRMAFANSSLSVDTPDGEVFTGGIFGFLDVTLSILKRLPAECDVFVAWEDSKRHRVALLPDYKLRAPDPKWEKLAEKVNDSADWLKRILRVSGWCQVYAPEWEADDAMGTVSLALNEAGENVVILSNDRDIFQCLRENPRSGWTRQLVPTKGVNVPWTVATLRDEWGVAPGDVALVKALSGDSSDCYKGVPGIGHKWACKIVQEYGSLDKIVEVARADGKIANSKKKAEDLLENLDYVRACFEVATIQTRTKVKLSEGSSDQEEIEDLFNELRLRSILASRYSMRRILT